MAGGFRKSMIFDDPISPFSTMIEILCIGKTKTPFVKQGITEFLQRLPKYQPTTYREVSEIKQPTGFLIALDVKGKEMNSPELAQTLKKLLLQEKKITFVIGEANGLPTEIVNKANLRLSLSQMTFPHELVRIIFLEQLYRAFSIIHNEPYHKE